jgi:dolichyl-phosphate-mannose-protein mannosyltransferase
MSTPQQALRHRGEKPNKRKLTPEPSVVEDDDKVLAKAQAEVAKPKKNSEWDYKLAVVIVTIAAFATRFYGISHPNQVVFDEVHFGKVFLHYNIS